MSYTIEEKELTETPILFRSKRIRPEQIPDTLGELFAAVHGFAVKNGIAMAGPPFCRYCDVTPGGMTLEAGMPIAAPTEGEGEGGVQAGVLPAGTAATTIHTGPYEELPQAHAAIEQWLEESAIEPAGDPWEVYLTDPGQVPDPAEWQTEVIRPIRE